MNLSRRLISRCAVLDKEGDDAQIDLTAFIRRLVLFDTYILESIRLKELPHLLRVFGYDGLVTLLQSDALRIHCDAVTLGSVGQLSVLNWRRQKGLLPLGSYAFSTVRITNWHSYIEECLRVLDPVVTLTSNERVKLENVIKSSLVISPSDFGTMSLTQLKTDMAKNTPIIKTLVMRTLKDKLGASVTPDDFTIKIDQIDDSDFRAESDIADRFSLDQLDAHKIIESALLAVGGLNQRIEEMRAYSAISGFLPDEVAIFGDKLSFLVEPLLPRVQEEKFQRVLNIKEVPELDHIDKRTKLDAEKLLKIRDSVECREFRTWLSTIGSASDSEIRERVASLQARLSALAHIRPGKVSRFLTITGIGFVPAVGSVLGPVLGILDYFLVDRLIPYSGPATFINEIYPSIFKRD